MRPPTANYGKYKFQYKQVPYDDRYYFVFYEGIEIMKIPSRLRFIFDQVIYGTFLYDSWFDRFSGRVDKYNKWLDETND